MKKFLFAFLIVSFFSTPFWVHAEQVGFPEKSLWYSTDVLQVGEVITIYSLVVNGESSTLSGTVHFYDRDIVLGERKITIEKNQAEVVSLPWKVTEGEHQFSARFSQAVLTDNNGLKVSIAPTGSETKKDTVYVKKSSSTKESTEDQSALSSQTAVAGNSVPVEIAKATDFIKDKTPDNVEEKVTSFAGEVENFRETWEDQFSERKEDEQEKLDALNEYYEDRLRAKDEADVDNYVKQSYVDSSGENILKKPFHYIAIFFYLLMAFVLGNTLIFYGLSILVVFLVLRAIYRRVRN